VERKVTFTEEKVQSPGLRSGMSSEDTDMFRGNDVRARSRWLRARPPAREGGGRTKRNN